MYIDTCSKVKATLRFWITKLTLKQKSSPVTNELVTVRLTVTFINSQKIIKDSICIEYIRQPFLIAQRGNYPLDENILLPG